MGASPRLRRVDPRQLAVDQADLPQLRKPRAILGSAPAGHRRDDMLREPPQLLEEIEPWSSPFGVEDRS